MTDRPIPATEAGEAAFVVTRDSLAEALFQSQGVRLADGGLGSHDADAAAILAALSAREAEPAKPNVRLRCVVCGEPSLTATDRHYHYEPIAALRSAREADTPTDDAGFAALALTDQPISTVTEDGDHDHTGVPCRTCVLLGAEDWSVDRLAKALPYDDFDREEGESSGSAGLRAASSVACPPPPSRRPPHQSRADSSET